MTPRTYDIAVIGSGFAGSLTAMICHRLGRSVVLLEKGKHPRFTIGESSTPLTNLLLEELAAQYNLPALAPLVKWGSWQETYPDIACGLKRGFSFYHHILGQPDGDDPERQNQLLVAASPNDRISDTHWYRPDFDQFFAQQVQKLGIDYIEETDLQTISEHHDEIELTGSREGEPVSIRAKFIIDATGPRGFIHRVLRLTELPIPDLPPTQALYNHFTGVGCYADTQNPKGEVPPYPIDSAAVHHVFEGGWIWVLQFNNCVTSAGVAATTPAAERLQLKDGESAWHKLLSLIPSLRQQFANAKPTRPFVYAPQLSFRSGSVSGNRWVLLPSAAGFVDPLLSTGFAMTLLGISRLTETIEHHWEAADFSSRVRAVAGQSEGELLAAGRLIGSLYASMARFPLFTSVSFLYFTAVIFSETARRLGRPELAQSFLLHDHEYFGPQCLNVYRQVRKANWQAVCKDIIHAIEPLNLAGLGQPERCNWYPVDSADLFKNAWKIGASEKEIAELLKRSGF